MTTWQGEAGDPGELADEIAAAPTHTCDIADVTIELVTITFSVANRDLILRGLRDLRRKVEN